MKPRNQLWLLLFFAMMLFELVPSFTRLSLSYFTSTLRMLVRLYERIG
jgi:hypothetical protein